MNFDVIVVGGGMVGASMACALSGTGLRVAVVEAHPPDADAQPSYDERTIALTYSSRQIFAGLGVWDAIEATGEAWPIFDIEVSDRGHLGACRLSHADVGTEALGYVVPTRVAGQALHARMHAAEDITLFCPAEATDIERQDAGVAVVVNAGADKRRRVLTARLLVIADGGRSSLGDRLGFGRDHQPYVQSALITTVTTDRLHRGTAYERFVGTGPLALLPMQARDFAVVWTLEPADVEIHKDLSDERFLARLQLAFGDRAGTFEHASARQVYPLSLVRVDQPGEPRVVAIGNAAHIVHPVAGQGFNLGLKDVADLAQLVCDAAGRGQDIGAKSVIGRYARNRRRETRNVLEFTDRMIGIFSSEFLPLVVGRNLGLLAVDKLPPVKRELLRRTMGMHGRQPKLAAGRPLRVGRERAAQHYDIIIVGAGLIGSAFACALGNTNYRVVILDKSPPPAAPTGDFQLRINAYNRAAEDLLREVGAWDRIPEERRFAFRKMFVGSEGGAGAVTFAAADIGETYLGHFIENDLVSRALIDQVQTFGNVDVRTDVEIQDIRFDAERVTVIGAGTETFSAALLVGSDGAESRVRALAGISVRRRPYGQKCIVGTVEFDGDLEETAWQRFLTTGPLGLLPLRPGACSLAWSCDRARADRLMQMADKAFIAELDAAIVGRLGKITKMGKRGAFPLIERDASTYVAERTALIGDAAHVIHPLAGLGANIGFQDAAELAGLLVRTQARPGEDIGSRELLRRYERRRHSEDRAVMATMSGFNTVFSNDFFLLSRLRDRGLMLADKLAPAKNFLLRRAMWMNLNPQRRAP